MSPSREGRLRDEVRSDEDVSVRRFVLNDLLTNGFVVQERDTGALAIVDPGARPDDLMAAAASWGGDVRWILVTHLHGDHCAAVDAIRGRTGAPVAGPPGAPFVPERPVAGGETLDFGALSVQVCATPGHSPESLSYQIDRHMFVGDFLFRLGSGRTDGPGASTEDLFATIRDVFDDLPDETILWCGHGPPSTVGEERAGNPFWRVARSGERPRAAGRALYGGVPAEVVAWADDYDGGRKALLRLPDERLVIVPGSRLEVRE